MSTDLNPKHHLIYAAQSIEQADAIFWRNDDPDREAASYLINVARAHAAIAAALVAAHLHPHADIHGAITPCCGRLVFQLPVTDRTTIDESQVTCGTEK